MSQPANTDFAAAGVQDPTRGTASPRPAPFTWSSWVARLMAEWSQCLYASWFRTHHTFQALPSDYDATKWRMDHNEMLTEECRKQQEAGYQVRLGKQNQWRLRNRAGATLSGEPDLVCTDAGGQTLLINVHPGQPKPDHVVDMIISMYAWPLTHAGDVPVPEGLLIYREGSTEVPSRAVNDDFKAFFKKTMQTLLADAPPEARPSFEECRFCPIGPRDCSVRVDRDPMEETNAAAAAASPSGQQPAGSQPQAEAVPQNGAA